MNIPFLSRGGVAIIKQLPFPCFPNMRKACWIHRGFPNSSHKQNITVKEKKFVLFILRLFINILKIYLRIVRTKITFPNQLTKGRWLQVICQKTSLWKLSRIISERTYSNFVFFWLHVSHLIPHTEFQRSHKSSNAWKNSERLDTTIATTGSSPSKIVSN